MASQRQKYARAVSRSKYCLRAHVAWLQRAARSKPRIWNRAANCCIRIGCCSVDEGLCDAIEVLRRLRNGGQQFVRVEHVHVNDGGQAVTAMSKNPIVAPNFSGLFLNIG